MLFRKLTQADTYVDALRRYGLPYVIEGEKHFYRRQEVIDLMNVLRVLDHPHDNVALAGVLLGRLIARLTNFSPATLIGLVVGMIVGGFAVYWNVRRSLGDEDGRGSQ